MDLTLTVTDGERNMLRSLTHYMLTRHHDADTGFPLQTGERATLQRVQAKLEATLAPAAAPLIWIVVSPNGDIELLDECPRWDWQAEGQIVRSGYVNGGDSALVPPKAAPQREQTTHGDPLATLKAVEALLEDLDATLEYPGFIRVPISEHAQLAASFGTVNEFWGGDLTSSDGAAHHTSDDLDPAILSTSTDAAAIAAGIRVIVHRWRDQFDDTYDCPGHYLATSELCTQCGLTADEHADADADDE